uniref:Coiled-coil domain-containing protein 61 n=1 Tax=Phaeomonas parva TaxID=124430 RepID=A0A7S1XTT5_9STRA
MAAALGELHERLSFHGTDYLITADASAPERLVVEAEEDLGGGRRWRADFSASYIQDLTHKTGNFKTFDVFVRMLYAGLRGDSDSVFIDLLTYQDLELLKARKSGRPVGERGSPGSGSIAPNPKRYLIMTYAAEFDRVHYPLPLNFEPDPTPDSLNRTIRRLRGEADGLQKKLAAAEARASAAEATAAEQGTLASSVAGSDAADGLSQTQLRAENQHLRQKLRAAIAGTAHGDDILALQKENDRLRKELRSIMGAFDSYRQETSRQVRRLKKESMVERFGSGNGDPAQFELTSRRGKENALSKAYASSPGNKDLLAKKVSKLERMIGEEKKANRRREGKYRGEISELRRQLEKEREAAKRASARSQDLSRRLNLSLSRRRSTSASSRRSMRSQSPGVTPKSRATPSSSARRARRTPSTFGSAPRSGRRTRDSSVGSTRNSVLSSGGSRRSKTRSSAKKAARGRARTSAASGYSSASSRGSSRSVSSTRMAPRRATGTKGRSRSNSSLRSRSASKSSSVARKGGSRLRRRRTPKADLAKASPMSSVTNSIASDGPLMALASTKGVAGKKKKKKAGAPMAPVEPNLVGLPQDVSRPDEEVNDIDLRLQQLQAFLTQAKRGMIEDA